ncbi:MAG: CYCXC family (seleno)protein [Pyrinomonadaceae bacterium]
MKSKYLSLTLLSGALLFAACTPADKRRSGQAAVTASPQSMATQRSAAPVSKTHNTTPASGVAVDEHGHTAGHSHGAESDPKRVPAFQSDAASLKNLPPTLASEKFSGKQREAYAAVKEIPKTIAQLPCYCYCDKGFGHKSLHSCFVDTHAAHCAVCVDEALLAYRLQKEEKLTPAQVRERIIAEYAPKSE